MHKSKFIQILKALDREEFKKFSRFIRSEFFNTDKSVIKLFETIKPFYPDFESEELDKEKVHKKIFSGKKYSLKNIERVSSQMLHLAQEYLTYIAIKKEPFVSYHYLLDELCERKQFNLFEKNLKLARRQLDEMPVVNSAVYRYRFDLENQIIRYLNVKESVPFQKEDNAQKIADNLLNFFLIEILEIYGYMINQSKNAFEYKFEYNFIDELKLHFEKNNYEDIPYMMMSYHRLMLLLTEDSKYYYSLKKLLTEMPEANKVQMMNSYIVILNYCYRQYMKGHESFLGEQFEIYKEVLPTKIYLNLEYMHHLFFKDIVTCSLDCGELQWAEKFINDYKNELTDEHKSNMYDFCLALVNFMKKDYDKTLEYLSGVQAEDITYKLDIKSLLSKVYFEMMAEDSLISLIDSYKHLISKNKLVPQRLKKRHINYIKFLERLLHIKDSNDKFELQKFKDEVGSVNELINKQWLIEKINDI